MTKKTVEKVYGPKVGDVIAFHGNGTFQACYAVVVSKNFFTKQADSNMKEIFEFSSHVDSDKKPVFILRINNGADEFGRTVFVPAFLFVDCYEYKFTFLYSVFDKAKRNFTETAFQSFNDVFVTEHNRGRSPHYHIFESLKDIPKHVYENKLTEPQNLYCHFICDLQSSYGYKNGGSNE